MSLRAVIRQSCLLNHNVIGTFCILNFLHFLQLISNIAVRDVNARSNDISIDIYVVKSNKYQRDLKVQWSQSVLVGCLWLPVGASNFWILMYCRIKRIRSNINDYKWNVCDDVDVRQGSRWRTRTIAISLKLPVIVLRYLLAIWGLSNWNLLQNLNSLTLLISY